MITTEFFTNEVSKLIDQFGSNKFSVRKTQLIYMAIKKLEPSELAKIIDDVVGNMKFAPTVSEIRDKAREYLQGKIGDDMQPCYTCNAMGIVNVRRKTGEVGEYAFSCTCPNGDKFQYLPKWQDKFKKEFTKQIIPAGLIKEFYDKPKPDISVPKGFVQPTNITGEKIRRSKYLDPAADDQKLFEEKKRKALSSSNLDAV